MHQCIEIRWLSCSFNCDAGAGQLRQNDTGSHRSERWHCVSVCSACYNGRFLCSQSKCAKWSKIALHSRNMLLGLSPEGVFN